LELFFEGLIKESSTVRISVQAGLSTFMPILKNLNDENTKKLEELLLEYIVKVLFIYFFQKKTN